MTHMLFIDLFDFLDNTLSDEECDNTMRLTRSYLAENQVENTDEVLKWLSEHGGYCDCEVLMNVEEYFE